MADRGSRFLAYVQHLAGTPVVPVVPERYLRADCAGLLLPGERKSIEPMAARAGGAALPPSGLARRLAPPIAVSSARSSDC